jgi:NAD(P)-dependent dehydrogenase (short-subunit alcohol dehydrogenase family)
MREVETYQKELFKGKVAVVTGATSNGGLGTATAFYLANLGAKVYALGLDADKTEIPDDYTSKVEVIEMDVTDDEKLKTFFEGLNQLDILVNGAGMALPDQYPIENFRKVMDVNANATFYISNLAAPLLKESDIASIINVSSMYAIFGSDTNPAYATSKGAIDQMTKSLAIQFAKDGIRVNAVAPGFIQTPLMDNIPEELHDPIKEMTPLKRIGNPEEIGQVVAFLSSKAASFISGVILPVDGGYSIMKY